MDRQTFTIGCLSLSAIILLVGVFVVGGLEVQTAHASGMIDKDSKRYTLLTGQLDEATELIYLIDSRTEKLAVYSINASTGTLNRTDLQTLDRASQNSKKKGGKLRP